MFHFAIQSAFPSLFWFGVGFIISIIGINPLLMLLFFDLPTASAFWKKGYFESKAPIFAYIVTLFIVVTITLIGWNTAIAFSNNCFWIFLWGLGIALIPGVAALLRAKENLSDFLQDNWTYLSPSALTEFQHLPITGSIQKQQSCPFEWPRFLKFLKHFKIKISIGKFQILIQ